MVRRPITVIGIATLVLFAAITAGAATSSSQPLSVSGEATTDTVTPGTNVTVSFTGTNNGSQTTGVLAITDIPENWSVVSTSGDGNYRDASNEFLYLSIDSDTSVTSSVTMNVPADASLGEYIIGAEFRNSSNVAVDTANVTTSVTQPLDVTASSASIAQSESDQVSFTVSNDGTADTGAALQINRSSIPDSWTLSAEGDGNFKSSADQLEYLYLTVPAGGTVESGLTITVPDEAATGQYNLTATVTTDGQTAASAPFTVSIEENITQSYDRDNSGSIGTSEVLLGVSDWESDSLSTAEVLRLISAWEAS